MTITITDPSPQRIDINTNATGITVSAIYDYDGTAFDGTLTLNNTIFNYGTAQIQWYAIQSVSGGSYGITVTSVNDVTYCIWDSLTITITDPAPQRININTNATGIIVSAIYDYDGAAFDGALTLNNTNFNYGSAQIQWYAIQSVSGGSYGIDAISTNDLTFCIWDSLTITITNPAPQRININTNATGITVSAVYDYDGAAFDGALTLNSTNFNYGTAQIQWYAVQSASGGIYGITAISVNDLTYCIWDSLTIAISDPSPQRININTNATGITVSAVYDYDGAAFDGALTLNSTNFNYGTAQIQWYTVLSASGSSYGITAISVNDLTYCIWDSLTITIMDPTPQRININTNATGITVSAVYDYDGVTFDGTLVLNNTNFNYGTAQIQWYAIQSVSGGSYGISAISVNDLTYCIWDSLTISITDPTDQRIPVNTNATGIFMSAVYDYDGAVFDGTLTLNNTVFNYGTAQIQWYTVASASGDSYGITTISVNDLAYCIWDQIIVTIGVDDSTPLNTVQANFTLSVIFDYDGSICTTYQIVIQRNGTWWHSFTDSNKSLFVDVNSDVQYTYSVQVVTSESSYDILAFSTNNQQVVWSAAPNNAPTNDNAPTLTNPDDTNYLYARYKYYIITTNVSDADGWDTINYVELTLYDDSRSNIEWTVRYTVATDTFSIEAGNSVIVLGSSSRATGSGSNLDVVWYIKIDWSHADLSNTDTRQYVYDGLIGVENFYETNWNVETRLAITGLSVSDGLGTGNRGPLNGSFLVTGTIIYLGSVDNYPLSNETDVWLSSSEYGANIGPWSDLTLISGFFNITAYADDVVGLDTLTITVVTESAGSGGTDLLSTPTQTSYIADRVQVQSYSTSDSHANIGDTVTIDVELAYEYDTSPVTDGSVSINGLSATYVGSGIWQISDSRLTVQSVIYVTSSYTGGTYGLNEVNLNAMSQEVIWDQIIVQTTLADSSRVNVNTNVEVRVTLTLAYDSSPLGAGDTVTLNGQAMTWDSGNARFALNVSQATVGQWSYYVNSTSESGYSITAFDLNSQSVSIIWDQIVVQTTTVDDNRLNVNANAEIRVTLMLAYDGTYLGSGDSVTLDGTPMTWDGVNTWFALTVTQSSVGAWTYFVNATFDATYGITSFILNSNRVQVIWDQIVVQTTLANSTRINMGDAVEIQVTLWRAYDHTPLGASDNVTLDDTLMTYDGLNSRFELPVSQGAVGQWMYYVNSTSDATYGITAFDLNSKQVVVIWDRIVVQTTSVDDGRIDVNSNAEIHVTLILEYDGTSLGASNSVTLNGVSMTWDGSNGWFALNVSQSTVGAWVYFVNASTATSYGVDLVSLNGNSVSIIWDRVQVVSYSTSDDHVNIGDSVDIDVALIYAYDNLPVTTGTVTINGNSASNQGGGVWRITESETSATRNTYNLVVSTGNAYALSVVDQNSQSLDVTWDRLVITIGVDDASLLNGHQANFSLAVSYEYNSIICTTYQIVIQRNGTWWHSFTDANVSLFVDSGIDISYLYNASFVTSELTYGITAFTTNTQQVTWSLAPNEVPVNDAMPLLANGDDTNYLYARYRYYIINTSVSDPDGYNDISYVELTLYSDNDTIQYWTIRYDVGSNTFSVESGGSVVTIGAWSFATGAGTNLTISWYIKIGWSHVNIQNSDILQYVTDGIASDSDFYETNWNVETRLDYSAVPSLSDDRGNVGTSNLFATGSVTYYGSSLSPLSNETDVWILHDISGAWSGNLVAGSFNITDIGSSSSVRLNTYTFKIVPEGAGSGAADLYYSTSPEDTFISDRIEIFEAGVVNGRIDINSAGEVWWRARYEYDSVVIQNLLTLTLNNSHTAVWDPVNLYWSYQESWGVPHSEGYNVIFASETTYGIYAWNVTTSVQQVIWDALVISISDPIDQRIDVNTNATGITVTAVYAFDGTPFDGLFSLNSSVFSYATPQRQAYTVSSVSGDSYGITAILSNDVTYCIWDRVLVVSISADEAFHNLNDAVSLSVILHYEYDDVPVTTGTFSIAGHPLTHVASGEWQASITETDYNSIDFDDLTACDASLHGISTYNMNSNSVTVYWDRIEFYSATVNDDRVDVGSSVEISWSVRLEHAGLAITSGLTATMTGDVSLTSAAGVYSGSETKTSVGIFSFAVTGASLGAIDAFVQSVADVSVIWDQVKLTSITASSLSQDAGDATEIHVTLAYEYDNAPVVDGTVTLDDNGQSIPMTYDSTNEYWKASVTKTTGGDYSFTVASVASNTYGITALNLDGKSLQIEWVQVPGFAPDTMTIILLGGGAGIAILGVAIVAMKRRGGAAAASIADIAPTSPESVEPIALSEPATPAQEEIAPVSESLGADVEGAAVPAAEAVSKVGGTEESLGVEEITPTETGVDESVDILPETELEALLGEELESAEVTEGAPEAPVSDELSVTEPGKEIGEITPSIEEATSVEATIQEPSEIGEEAVSPEAPVEPEAVEMPSEIEPEVPVEEVSLDKLSKKELLDCLPPEVRDAIPKGDLKKMSRKDIQNLVESYTPAEKPIPKVATESISVLPPEAILAGRSLAELDKSELIKLLPEDISDTISAGELRRLSKKELISLLESVLDIDEK